MDNRLNSIQRVAAACVACLGLAVSCWLSMSGAMAQSTSANYSALPGIFSIGGGPTASMSFQQDGQWGVWFNNPPANSANFKTQISGACGADSGTTIIATPVSLCSGGTATIPVAGNTSYTWSCNGGNGGAIASCYATRNYVVASSVTGGNGGISGSQNVAYDATPAFTLTPNTCYAPASMTGTCGGALTGNNFATSPIVAGCTVVASFALVNYTVTFNSSGGSAVPNHNVGCNSTTTPPPPPIRSGFSFGGWYSDAGLTSAFSFATPITADTALYAKWTINVYAVTFTVNGGPAVATQNVNHNNTATQPAAPTRTGYTFGGWFSDAALANAYSFATPVTADTTLFAKWTINVYTVTFTVNGGSAVASQNVNYNNTATQPTAPTRPNYTFGGWFSDAGLATAFSFATPVTADITVFAKWTINVYAVTFTANGGSAVASQNVTYNTTATQPAAPTRTGYSFGGWFSDAGLTSAFSFATPINANITLYANWTALYTVTYAGNASTGGTAPLDPSSYVAGATVTVLGNTGNLVRTGFLFAGWNTVANDSGTAYKPGATFSMGAADLTLFTRWTAIVLDVDANQHYDALTDGLIILRYLFGLTGSPMVSGATGSGATRADPLQVKQYLDAVKPLLDVDGNGQSDALTDGLMILRYLFGLRGSPLTAGALGPGATRTLPADIETYIASLMQ